MCLEFGCFGGRTRDDYGRRGHSRGNGYWSAPALPPAPVYQQLPAVANHDGAPKAGHADAGSHSGDAYLQDKAGSETPPKLPTCHNKVGDDAGHGAYTPRPQEAAADHRNNAMEYKHSRKVLGSSLD